MTVNFYSIKILAMNYKEYSPTIWQKIESTLNDLKKTSSDLKLTAAFDADGTLWDTDLGENFFEYQIENKLVELPNEAFKYYNELKKLNNDPCLAYLWLAQVNKNQNIQTVQNWATKAYNEVQPNPIFSEQKKLVNLLKLHQVEIYIVTASVKWAVEPGAQALGIDSDHVIGVETEIHNNIITDIPIYPVTYRQGKADALLMKTKNIKPILSSGNSIGDFELLKLATHLQLAVSAASRDDLLFKSESELNTKAIEHGWMTHRFI